MTRPLNRTSSRITSPKSQGASQAMLYAVGLTEADMGKAQVGIASCWFEGNPCNMHLLDLGAEVAAGVRGADLVGLRFNTIGVSDGISMGTEGMSYSLPSRDLIADSIETVMRAQWYDALVAIPGCDKNMPGAVMAMGRLDRPALMVYGGTIRAALALALGVPPQTALSFTVENCSITRLDYLHPPGIAGLWRVGAVNHRPWSRTPAADRLEHDPIALDKA